MKNKIISFVWSTGRTGTVTLTNVLNTGKNVKAIHEPSPSRRLFVFSRLYLEGKLRKEKLADIYFRSRKRILDKIEEGHYIEVNPFAWALGDIICEKLGNPKILHIVRDIRTYVISRINFKARGWHRYIIEYIPFWELKVNRIIKSIDNWNSLTKEEKIAWRWVLVNKTLDENEKNTHNYLRVRFEDIFSKNPEVKKETLMRISNFFDIDMDIEKSYNLVKNKFNASKKKYVRSFESFNNGLQKSILNITALLREKYGYL